MLVLSLLEPEEAIRDAELRRQWELSLGLVNPLNRIFASPDWFFHRWRVFHRGNRLAILRDGEHRVIGICPLDFYPVTLNYGVRKWIFRTIAFPAAVLMGGEPMLAAEPALYRALFDGLFKELKGCGCITLESSPLESMTWKYFQGPGGRSRNYYTYDPIGERRTWYYIELGQDFDRYLESLPSKSRTNIKNKERKFRKNSPARSHVSRYGPRTRLTASTNPHARSPNDRGDIENSAGNSAIPRWSSTHSETWLAATCSERTC